MVNKIYNRKNINLFDTNETLFTSWNIPYSLYADIEDYESNEADYYADCDDNSREVTKLGSFATLEEAKKSFKDHIATIEDPEY